MTYTRKDIVSDFYNQSDENDRLQRTRHGQLEYFTTMTYIHRYADQQSKVLVGLYMLIYLGLICKENMQIEGFWYYLFTGVFEAATIHYAVAKIFGPLLCH